MRRTKPIPRDALAVRRSQSGLGLFATALIKPGSYIEYTGNMLTNNEANAKKDARYLFEVNTRWTIDGSPRSNLARYVNHDCNPNCESCQTGTRIFIVATHRIRPGEQLTYDYGSEYFDEFIKPYGCRCRTCARYQHERTRRSPLKGT
jgi:SET domain-containing protein